MAGKRCWAVLYTKHLTKKSKTWADGFLILRDPCDPACAARLLDEHGKSVGSARIACARIEDAQAAGEHMKQFEGLLVDVQEPCSEAQVPGSTAAAPVAAAAAAGAGRRGLAAGTVGRVAALAAPHASEAVDDAAARAAGAAGTGMDGLWDKGAQRNSGGAQRHPGRKHWRPPQPSAPVAQSGEAAGLHGSWEGQRQQQQQQQQQQHWQQYPEPQASAQAQVQVQSQATGGHAIGRLPPPPQHVQRTALGVSAGSRAGYSAADAVMASSAVRTGGS